MKRISQIMLMVAILGVAACNGSSGRNEKQTADPGAAETGKARPAGSAAEMAAGQQAVVEDALRMSEIRLSPAPLTASVDLTAEPILAGPAPQMVSFEYRWYVNDKPVEGDSGPTLSRENYRKKQWVFCEVRATSGMRSGPWQHSKFVRVVNMPPQLVAVPINHFFVPGEVTYQISASDPDGDPLAYELLSPLDQGIVLDPNSGLLTWKIEVAMIQSLGETIEIQFAVKDDEGQRTTGGITLHLSKQPR